MADPMTPERRAEIREAARPGYADILAQLIKHGAHDDPKHGKVIVHGVTVVPAADLKAAVRVVWFGAPALLVEVERLREELALAFSPGMYLDIQKVLDGALGTNEADGAGEGIVADVALIADSMKKAETERDQLRAELATTKEERNDYAARFRATDSEYAEHLKRAEKVKAELATVLKNYEGLQGTAIRLEGERDEARVAVAEEQRIADERRTALLEERDQARHDLAEAEAERDDARDAEAAARRNYASAENENVSLRARAEKAEEERDAAHEQVKDTERAVHGFFADADQRGVHLDGMTVDELCDAVMAAIRKGPGR